MKVHQDNILRTLQRALEEKEQISLSCTTEEALRLGGKGARQHDLEVALGRLPAEYQVTHGKKVTIKKRKEKTQWKIPRFDAVPYSPTFNLYLREKAFKTIEIQHYQINTEVDEQALKEALETFIPAIRWRKAIPMKREGIKLIPTEELSLPPGQYIVLTKIKQTTGRTIQIVSQARLINEKRNKGELKYLIFQEELLQGESYQVRFEDKRTLL